MRFYIILAISVLCSCAQESKTDILYFKEGKFKTYLGQRKDSSFFHRNNKQQIESYQNQIDTFDIVWINNFEYRLQKVNPKSKLDSLPFVVKITGLKKDHYDFKAYYLGSNFKQEGKTYKISD